MLRNILTRYLLILSPFFFPYQRPPKYLTPEERLAARRQQIRNNVRAYRERKLERKSSSGDGEEIDASTAKQAPTRRPRKTSSSSTFPPFLITSHDIDGKAGQRRNGALTGEQLSKVPDTPYTNNERYEYPEAGTTEKATHHLEEYSYATGSSSDNSELDEATETFRANNFHDSTALTRYTPSPSSTDIVHYSDSSPLALSFGYFEAIVRDGDAWVNGYPFWDTLQQLRDDTLASISVLSATTAGFAILTRDPGPVSYTHLTLPTKRIV